MSIDDFSLIIPWRIRHMAIDSTCYRYKHTQGNFTVAIGLLFLYRSVRWKLKLIFPISYIIAHHYIGEPHQSIISMKMDFPWKQKYAICIYHVSIYIDCLFSNIPFQENTAHTIENFSNFFQQLSNNDITTSLLQPS